MSAVSKSIPAFKWPNNLKDVCLNTSDVTIIERVIIYFRENFDLRGECKVALHRQKAVYPEGIEAEIPRRVIVYKHHSIVVLNSKGKIPLEGRSDQPSIKWAYNSDSGVFCLKKKIFSLDQLTLLRYIQEKSREVEAFAEIFHLETIGEKTNYFEKYYPKTLCRVDLSTIRLQHYRSQSLIDT